MKPEHENYWEDLFAKHRLFPGRNFGSKMSYSVRHAKNLIIFNAMVYTATQYKSNVYFKYPDEEKYPPVWCGDLNLNEDIGNLFDVARESNSFLVVTRQSGKKVVELGELL